MNHAGRSAIRTQIHRGGGEGGKGILYYLYADPGCWPDGRKVDAGRRANHLEEIERFSQEVANDEVQLIACSYRGLLTGWKQAESALLRRHARAVAEWAGIVVE